VLAKPIINYFRILENRLTVVLHCVRVHPLIRSYHSPPGGTPRGYFGNFGVREGTTIVNHVAKLHGLLSPYREAPAELLVLCHCLGVLHAFILLQAKVFSPRVTAPASNCFNNFNWDLHFEVVVETAYAQGMRAVILST
jgi:hypothetical protein